MTKRTFTFAKHKNGEWYLDLPDWKGPQEELQMVEGADKWLDLLSGENTEVHVFMADEYFEGAEVLALVRLRENNLGGGGIYCLSTYLDRKIDLQLWLCEVTAFVFGYIPTNIFFKKSD